MTDVAKKAPGLWARFIPWIKDQWVREVPDEIAVCEFDCRKNQCLEGEWLSCARRIRSGPPENRCPSHQKRRKNLNPDCGPASRVSGFGPLAYEPARQDKAIQEAAFLLERIDKRWTEEPIRKAVRLDADDRVHLGRDI